MLNQSAVPLLCSGAALPAYQAVHTVFPVGLQARPGYGHLALSLAQIKEISAQAGPGHLVILDDVPSGTDYKELVAITVVAVEDLIARGAAVVVTGHAKKAFHLLAERTGALPVMTAMRVENGRLVPDYQLRSGVAKHSYGIERLPEAGFPEEVVTWARQYYEEITGEPYPATLLPAHLPAPWPANDPQELTPVINSALRIYSREFFVFEGSRISIICAMLNWQEPRMDLKELIRPGEKLGGQALTPDRARQGAFDRLTAVASLLAQDAKFVETLHTHVREAARLFHESTRRHYEAVEDQEIEDWRRALQMVTDTLAGIEADPVAAVVKDLQQSIDELPKNSAELSAAETPGMPQPDIQRGWQRQEIRNHWIGTMARDGSPLARLDLWCGMARAARARDLQRPEFSPDPGVLEIAAARPFSPTGTSLEPWLAARGMPSWVGEDIGLEPFIKDGQPIDLKADKAAPVTVLLGPNGSGKTVLEFTALGMSALALAGFYVPGRITISENAELHSYLGTPSPDGKEGSTFQRTLSRLSYIVNNAGPNSICILDEIGGSDFFEIAAIQLAVLRYLRDKGATVWYDTHLRDGLLSLSREHGVGLCRTDYDYDPVQNVMTPHFRVLPDPELSCRSHGLAVAAQYFTPAQIEEMRQIYEGLQASPEASFHRGG